MPSAAAGRPQLDAPVFIIGAPRSGTTWLQRLLATADEVVSGQESNLFDRYVAPLSETFARQVRQIPELSRVRGLPSVLTDTAFDELLRGVVLGTYAQLAALKPDATVVVDKNPPHTLHVPLIRRLLPRARFVHIVRDGRDVAASLVTAHAGWGRSWAPARVAEAAAQWQRFVLAARQARSDDGSFLEISYEQLQTDGPETLSRVFGFAGVEVDAGRAAALLAGQRGAAAPDPLVWGGEVARLTGGRKPEEPAGFARAGRSGSWQRDWSPVDRVGFDRAAGALLVELGYAADRSWAAGPGWARYVDGAQEGGSRLRRGLVEQARHLTRGR